MGEIPPSTYPPAPTALAEIQQRLYLLVYVTCLSSALVQSARATILNQIRPWEAAGWPSTTENVTKWPSMATFDSVLATFFNSGNTFWYKHGSNVADFLFFKSRATAIGNSNISKLVKCCIISTTMLCTTMLCSITATCRGPMSLASPWKLYGRLVHAGLHAPLHAPLHRVHMW